MGDGKRVSQPLPIPEKLLGKPLYPAVSFRCASLMVNFGPAPMAPLPFACRTMNDLSAKDCVLDKAAPPKDGKYEVMLPVGLPDEGTFDWLDSFLAKNPTYCELSDRAIVRWAEQSGMTRHPTRSRTNCRDKPDFQFGVAMMDDLSVQRVLKSVLATQPRNYVLMEVKANLLAADRADSLKRFPRSYTKVAHVVIGDPPADFREEMVLAPTLRVKQEKAEQEWRQRQLERESKKRMAQKVKEEGE